MHVLTKIFIVLVTLMAVLLVPLVVVYAHNENAYQRRYQNQEAAAAAARATLESAEITHGAAMQRKQNEIDELNGTNAALRKQTEGQEAEIRRLELRLSESIAADTELNSKVKTLADAVNQGQAMNSSLIEELRGLRTNVLGLQRQNVDLDEALRDALAKLDVAIEARRALEEECQRLKDEHATAMSTLQTYVGAFGNAPRSDAAQAGRPSPVDLDATILNVRRTSDQVLAEIDAGSRDGVERDVVMTVSVGGYFVARLRIVEVDINRSTGVVELEEVTGRRVEVGNKVLARAGR